MVISKTITSETIKLNVNVTRTNGCGAGLSIIYVMIFFSLAYFLAASKNHSAYRNSTIKEKSDKYFTKLSDLIGTAFYYDKKRPCLNILGNYVPI